VLEALKTQEATLDVYKGNPASFRPWDNQLRQPILLATTDSVIARAPLDRFLHQRNVLDTLGVDQPETRCRF
jgi:ABC transporter substrate binding protein (PQQ-dependent alcohol dehydrogenase system)